MSTITDPPCVGKAALFDSQYADDHHRARSICLACTQRKACAELAQQIESEPGGKGSLTGTWAGKGYSLWANRKPKTPKPRRHLNPEQNRDRGVVFRAIYAASVELGINFDDAVGGARLAAPARWVGIVAAGQLGMSGGAIGEALQCDRTVASYASRKVWANREWSDLATRVADELRRDGAA